MLWVWLPTAMYMVLIVQLSSLDLDLPQVQQFPFKDKGIHFLEYALLGWLCMRAATQTWPHAVRLRVALGAFMFAALFGLTDEVHQAFVPGRIAEAADLVADALGAAFGVALAHFLSGRGAGQAGLA